MFCKRQHGSEYSIKSYQICFLPVCLFFVCSCVVMSPCMHVYVAGFACAHGNIWHKPLFRKRHLLIMSCHNVPFRRVQKELIKKPLLSTCDVAAPVDGTTWAPSFQLLNIMSYIIPQFLTGNSRWINLYDCLNTVQCICAFISKRPSHKTNCHFQANSLVFGVADHNRLTNTCRMETFFFTLLLFIITNKTSPSSLWMKGNSAKVQS